MGRKIWAILGTVLSIWVASTAVGWISEMLKTFLIIGLIAVAVFLVVRVLAGRRRQD